MKYLYFINFLFISLSLYSQDTIIQGFVYSELNSPILGSGIYINDTLLATTNIKGYYSFVYNNHSKIKIIVKHRNYISDSIYIKLLTNNISNFNFTLKHKAVNLNEIKILAKSVNSFKKRDWIIIDFIVFKKSILVLSKEFNKSYLYCFSLNGKLKYKSRLSIEYNEIIISCLGGLHLIGKKECREFSIKNQKFSFGKVYSRKLFDDFLRNCCLTIDSITIFKELSQHNKNILFFYYNKENKEVNKIIEIKDLKAYNFAQGQYEKIIQEYYKTLFNPNKNEINYDFPKINIIESGEWDGDLTRLMISNELIKMISFYKFVLSHPLKAQIFKIDNELYIIDLVNNEIIKIKKNGRKIKTIPIVFNNCKKAIIIEDKCLETLFFVCKNKDIFKLDLTTGILQDYNIHLNNHLFPKQFVINDGTIYFISYDFHTSSFNTLNKIILK